MHLPDLVSHHIAKSVIGPSSARGLLSKGTIQSVRDFLRGLDTREFTKRGQFSGTLDLETRSLAAKVPTSWGAARKFLNLYLREITYNFFLREKYHLERVEHLLEVPLDSNVAKGLQGEKEGVRLPRWPGVIHLTPDTSAQYQSVAVAVAARKRTCRVHLDLLYWRPEEKNHSAKGRRALHLA
jgi:hypothetical protein